MQNVKSVKSMYPDNGKINRDQLLTTGDLFDFKISCCLRLKPC
jgi:hypothetical protein